MKRLTLTDVHERLGAKMGDFAGYYMPLQYQGVSIEHKAVREAVGVFDVSHMGEIFITGSRSEEFLQYITSNDVSKLHKGKVQYSYLPNQSGGIVDDFLLYKLLEDQYMLVVNASNLKKDIAWIHEHNRYDVKIEDKSNDYCLLAVQGPSSLDLLQEISNDTLSEINYYNFIIGSLSGVDDIIISRTGYTGELGFELYVRNEDACRLWESLFATSIHITPVGLAARDILRLEKGYCLYGNDIDENTSPIAAGLGWVTCFEKNFINCDMLFSQKTNGSDKQLVGIKLIDRGIARKGYSIFDSEGNHIGVITSGTMSLTLALPIALGYVSSKFSSLDSEIYISIRNKRIRSKVVSIPFVK